MARGEASGERFEQAEPQRPRTRSDKAAWDLLDAAPAGEAEDQQEPVNRARHIEGETPITTEQSEFISSELRTTAGSAFYYPDDDRFRSATADVPRFPGEFVIDVHGAPDTAALRSGDVEFELHAAAFAEVLRRSPYWDGKPIRLFSCQTGKDSDGFAQQLATELGVMVTAPTENVSTLEGSLGRVPERIETLEIAPDGMGQRLVLGRWQVFQPLMIN